MPRTRSELEHDLLRRRIAITVLGPPCTVEQIEEAERLLSQRLPDPLRDLYVLACELRASTNSPYLWPLLGEDGMVAYNLFVRKEEWFSPWIGAFLFFGMNRIGD